MRVRHRIFINAVCPVNGDPDRYVCDVFPSTLLFCETIVLWAKELTQQPITQEDLTAQLATKLGCPVRTRGTHCQGRVETVVVCRPRLKSEGRACGS